jgi:hypothetical protein
LCYWKDIVIWELNLWRSSPRCHFEKCTNLTSKKDDNMIKIDVDIKRRNVKKANIFQRIFDSAVDNVF